MAKKINKTEKPIKEGAPAPITEELEIKYVVVKTDNLNIRTEPSIESKILTIVSKGDRLSLSDTKSINDFYAISTSLGINGYVMKDFVIEEK